MVSSSPDVIVVGGGVIGCSIAYHLAKRNVGTLLLERGRVGAEASAAASGLVEGLLGDDPYSMLAHRSYNLFQKLAPELQDAGGVDIELLECGVLLVATEPEEAGLIEGWTRRFQNADREARWLDQATLRSEEPLVTEAALGAMLRPRVSRVNNQRIPEAFVRSAAALGAEYREMTEVAGLETNGSRVTGVRLADGTVKSAGSVVLAAGSWTGLLAKTAGLDVPVSPMRGVNLNLQPLGPRPRRAISGGHAYLVPRADGSVIAGPTVDEAGFDNRVTAEAVRWCLRQAVHFVPSFAEATLNWSRAGLRPRSADDVPIIGPVRGWDGLHLATGHFRDGITLSAATGEAVASQIAGDPPAWLSAFSPDRFLS